MERFTVARRAGGNERGFTLIETLLAFSILVVLLAIVFSAFRLGIRSWEKGEAAVDSTAARRAILSRLEKDAGSMYMYSQDNGSAQEGSKFLFSSADGALGFVTVSRGLAKWVYYSVDSTGLTIREKTVPAVGSDTREGGRLIEFEGNVNGMRFEYLGPSGWEEGWDMGMRKALPGAVRVKLSFRDGSAFSAVLPVGAGSL